MGRMSEDEEVEEGMGGEGEEVEEGMGGEVEEGMGGEVEEGMGGEVEEGMGGEVEEGMGGEGEEGMGGEDEEVEEGMGGEGEEVEWVGRMSEDEEVGERGGHFFPCLPLLLSHSDDGEIHHRVMDCKVCPDGLGKVAPQWTGEGLPPGEGLPHNGLGMVSPGGLGKVCPPMDWGRFALVDWGRFAPQCTGDGLPPNGLGMGYPLKIRSDGLGKVCPAMDLGKVCPAMDWGRYSPTDLFCCIDRQTSLVDSMCLQSL